MIHETWQPHVAAVSYGAAVGQSAAAQVAADRSRLVARYVNGWNTSVSVSLRFAGGFSPSPTAAVNLTQLVPPPAALGLTAPGAGCEPCAGTFYDPAPPPTPLCCSNPPGKPALVTPTHLQLPPGATAFTAPPFSYTTVVYSS